VRTLMASVLPSKAGRPLPLAALGLAAAVLALVLGGDRPFRAARTRNRSLALGLGVCTVVLMYRRRRPSVGPEQPATERGDIPRGPVTQALVPVNPADTSLDGPGHSVEQRLDEAIQETFPASDPIALHIE
jgi:hypothetical protein